MAFIYGLFDSLTGEIRYVGKTKHNLRDRLIRHVYDARKGGNVHRKAWIRQLESRGGYVSIKVIQTLLPEELDVAEQYWIAYFKAAGCRLTNHTPGGDGNRTGTKINPVARAKMSEQRRQDHAKEKALGVKRTWSPEGLASYRSKVVGRKSSEELKARLSVINSTRFADPEIRRKQGAYTQAGWDKITKRIIDNNGIVYISQSDVARKLGTSSGYISRVLKSNGRLTVKGRTLRYVTNLTTKD